ncbi:MAG TPA: LysM peptidoglycan-binding domain-containing protein [Limnochordia bacterium]|nr:LysM peptidoglycan-binding domain-containing protein [Limnochordia bacterium]
MTSRVHNAIQTVSVFGLLIILVVSIGAIAVKVAWLDGALATAGTELVYREVVVQPGDTLWTIAARQMPGEDPRDAVARIRQLNQLFSAEIYPGQVLTLEVLQPAQGQQLVYR